MGDVVFGRQHGLLLITQSPLERGAEEGDSPVGIAGNDLDVSRVGPP
jgi:hypothetical protein